MGLLNRLYWGESGKPDSSYNYFGADLPIDTTAKNFTNLNAVGEVEYTIEKGASGAATAAAIAVFAIAVIMLLGD